MTLELQNQPRQDPLVAIVIVNWNNWRDTVECLESVTRLDYHKYLTIVVDNASQDDSLAQLQEWARRKGTVPPLTYSGAKALVGGETLKERLIDASDLSNRIVLIQGTANTGPTGGGNLAIRYALTREQRIEYIFLLDNDATVESDTLSHLVSVDGKENAGIVGGVIVSHRTGEIQHAERTTLLRWFFSPLVSANLPMPSEEVEYWFSSGVSGGAMLIRRDVLDTIYASTGRYLAAETFMDGWEFEFCYRSGLAGYSSIVTRRGFVRHKGDRSARSQHSAKRYYYTTRNALLFAPDFLPFRWRLLFHPWYVLLCLGRIAKALKFGRRDITRAIADGWRDGIKGERKIRHEYDNSSA